MSRIPSLVGLGFWVADAVELLTDGLESAKAQDLKKVLMLSTAYAFFGFFYFLFSPAIEDTSIMILADQVGAENWANPSNVHPIKPHASAAVGLCQLRSIMGAIGGLSKG